MLCPLSRTEERVKMQQGWIRLYRKIQDNQLYPRRRRFTPFEAWVDLLLCASHKNHDVILGTTEIITVRRGQILTSQAGLAAEWRWDRGTVNQYLKLLFKLRQIAHIQTSKQTSTGFTLITIANYSKYQDSSETEPASNSTINPADEPASNPHTQ